MQMEALQESVRKDFSRNREDFSLWQYCDRIDLLNDEGSSERHAFSDTIPVGSGVDEVERRIRALCHKAMCLRAFKVLERLREQSVTECDMASVVDSIKASIPQRIATESGEFCSHCLRLLMNGRLAARLSHLMDSTDGAARINNIPVVVEDMITVTSENGSMRAAFMMPDDQMCLLYLDVTPRAATDSGCSHLCLGIAKDMEISVTEQDGNLRLMVTDSFQVMRPNPKAAVLFAVKAA